MEIKSYQKLILVALENKNFVKFKKGEHLLNYIFKLSEKEIIILSTYKESDFKYYAQIETSHENLDLLVNHLKQVTWTIDENQVLKTTINKNSIGIKKYLHNIVKLDSIVVYNVSDEFKAFLIKVRKEHINNLFQ